MYRPITTTQLGSSYRARLESLARDQTEAAINTIISIMKEVTVPAGVRLKAAELLLNRGWGKPKETHVVEDTEGRSLMRIVREIVHVTETQEMIEHENDDLVVDYRELKTVNGGGDGGTNGQ